MKNWLKDRNNWHIIGGVILEIAAYFLAFESYQMIGRFLISTILVSFACVIWEMVREDKWGYRFDWSDVRKGVYPAVITGAACVLVHSVIIGKFV